MIKSKADCLRIMNQLKESGETLKYETDSDIKSIKFDHNKNSFIVNNRSKHLTIMSNGICSESLLENQLYIDRKYINLRQEGVQLDNKSLNFKIPEELYNKLVEEAKAKNISLASIIRLICSEYFINKDKK